MIHSPFVTNLFIWIAIAFCIIQSAIFSGLNLAIFSVSKLRLEVEAAGNNRDAISLLGLRKDSNLTLSTVLWGNVTINVLLTLLSDSVLAGIGAFAFSTFVIHALRRDYSASLFFAKCPPDGGTAHTSAESLPSTALSGSETHSDYS